MVSKKNLFFIGADKKHSSYILYDLHFKPISKAVCWPFLITYYLITFHQN